MNFLSELSLSPAFSPQNTKKEQKSLEVSGIMPIFAATNLTTLPVEQRTRVRLFCFNEYRL